MTTYTTHPDGLFDPGDPILGSVALETRDNLISVAEGGPDAPRVQADAMQGSVAGDTLLFGTGGTGLILGEGNIPEAAFRATTDCEVRVRGEFRQVGAGADAQFVIYKNGVAAQTDSTGTSWSDSTPVDITLEAGDIITIRVFGGEAGPETSNAEARNIKYTVGSQRSVGGI